MRCQPIQCVETLDYSAGESPRKSRREMGAAKSIFQVNIETKSSSKGCKSRYSSSFGLRDFSSPNCINNRQRAPNKVEPYKDTDIARLLTHWLAS